METKTTWEDVSAKNCEIREWHSRGYYSRHGKSFIAICCPFCGRIENTYLWSLAGCGKRCINCGALFGSRGGAYKKRGTIVHGEK